MPATICVRRIDATLEAGVWRCPDERLRSYLQALVDQCPDQTGPDLDHEQALWVCIRVGGAMIPATPLEAPRTPKFSLSPAAQLFNDDQDLVHGGA